MELIKSRITSLFNDILVGHEVLKKDGVKEFLIRLFWYFTRKFYHSFIKRIYKIDYYEWIKINDTLSDEDKTLIKKHIISFKNYPKFSIFILINESDVNHLNQSIDSVFKQLYKNWELIIVIKPFTSKETINILKKYEIKDSRINLLFSKGNEGVSSYFNTAFEVATGDWVIQLDSDDLLSEHALYLVANLVNNNHEAAIVYSDHDNINSEGFRSNPYFKPDWDYDLFLGQNYINNLCAYYRELIIKVEGYREGFEGSEKWDLTTRILEKIDESQIYHIPFILYHKRIEKDEYSCNSLDSPSNSASKLLNEHFKRTSQGAIAYPLGQASCQIIKRELPAEKPLVSIIIPTKDHCEVVETCINSVIGLTTYKPYEIIIVDNGTTEQDALEFLSKINLKKNVEVLKDSGSFNFSRLINYGVQNSNGEICVLLNNDTEVINSGWLEEMVSHAIRPDVGAVGAKLYYPNNTIQHGGVITGIGGVSVAGHVHVNKDRNYSGYFNDLNLTRNTSCVTAACIAVRKGVFNEVGGFNEKYLEVAYNDVDFCLKLTQAGYKIIWTPQCELYHYESKSRGKNTNEEKRKRYHKEVLFMRRKWGQVLDNDKFYNPNFALRSKLFNLAMSPKTNKPWLQNEDSDFFKYSFVSKNKESKKNIEKEDISKTNYLEPIVFVHIPKTSGTSFRKGVEKSYGNESIAYDYGMTSPLTSDIIKNYFYNGGNLQILRDELISKKKFFLVGHFPVKRYRKIVNLENYIIFLREPVKRVLSAYNHFVNNKGYKKNLLEFIHTENQQNIQHKFIEGIDLEDIGFVGIKENYNKSLDLINSKYGLKIPKLNLNKGKYSSKTQNIDENLISHIKELNSKDIELYQRAINLFESTRDNYTKV